MKKLREILDTGIKLTAFLAILGTVLIVLISWIFDVRLPDSAGGLHVHEQLWLLLQQLRSKFPSFIEVSDYINFTYGAMTVVSAVLLYKALIAIRRKDAKTTQIAEDFLTFTKCYNDLLRAWLDKTRFNSQTKVVDAHHLGNEHVHAFTELANHIATIMSSCTDSRCCVNIKFYNPNEDEIVTFVRSSGTPTARDEVDHQKNKRTIEDHTPFELIVSNSSVNYYCENDLNKLEKRGKYKNRYNENRKKYYNSCAVFPISRVAFPKDKNEVWGFICVDSKKANFKKDYVIKAMEIMSRKISLFYERTIATVRLDDQ